ncbi:HEAT repeat domain-containing protein [Novipirellula artificiosorum]|uniref:HEAT repeat protein n=1 Tax=Novipirellula artificiosorum TaxID=2528016 RepID=A0A5C6DJX9_9BACT|nr:HEAT repeat domain-containing protein [Novipirellula artificiosorum]TWU36217.1 hypothetical protein Poly41_39720 [Novipirellula artificiosorum]
MFSGDSSELPNPFALHIDGNHATGKTSFKTAAKFFVIVSVLFAVTVAAGHYSRTWIVNRLMSGFSQLQTPEKQQRLVQIAELGLPSVEPLVSGLMDEQNEVARTAYELLRESQNRWTSLPWQDAREHHQTMIEAMQKVSLSLPEDRTGWASSLVQQTIMESVQESDEASRQLYHLATDTLSRMSLTEGAGPSILDDQPLDSRTPVRLAVRSKPLPVSEADALDAWTDWPIAEPQIISSGTRPPPTPQPQERSQATETTPSVYRSSATRLQPVDPTEAIVLNDIHETVARETNSTGVSRRTPTVVPTSYLTESPLETYDTPSVIKWLGHEQLPLREKAKRELTQRGFSTRQIEIATQVAAADSVSRLALVDSIARSRIDNPRPWLVMLLNDDNREVRLRTVSVIAPMNDAELNKALRTCLETERDPIVNARIRKVLKYR